jgi:hypothetical protein
VTVGSEEKATAKVKRSRKKQEHNEVEAKTEENAEFQKQGMSEVWQFFYARVREAVVE